MAMKQMMLAAALAGMFGLGWVLHGHPDATSVPLPDGGIYTGPLQDGLMQGQGEIRWPDGSRYQGELVAGVFHGRGLMEYADGSRYEGQWRDGEFIDPVADPQSDAASQKLEQALYSEQTRLQRQLASLVPGKPGVVELYFLGIAGDGTQQVFGREVGFVQQALQQRYGLDGHSLLLVNDRDRIGQMPMATRTSLQQALQTLGQVMNPAEDVLLLYLTSHGSPQHDFVLEQEGMLLPDLPAQQLADMLDAAGIRWQLVILSACFSGGAVPLLQNPDRLVMASAAADRSSFGCSDDAELTWFGRALFGEAFPRHLDWVEQFRAAQDWIAQQEKIESMEPSLPQLAAGDAVLEQLRRIPLRPVPLRESTP